MLCRLLAENGLISYRAANAFMLLPVFLVSSSSLPDVPITRHVSYRLRARARRFQELSTI